MALKTRTNALVPTVPENRAGIADQLKRILANPLFNQSKRYAPFLRYVVEKTLAGEEGELKERTIGVEVFGREPSYECNSDPVVRVTASEVRRRIARYYYESEHKQELQIDLQPGSYLPSFFAAPVYESASNPDDTTEPQIKVVPRRLSRNGLSLIKQNWTLSLIGSVAFVVLLGFVVFAHKWQTRNDSALEQWWQPVIHSSSPVLISVGMRAERGRSSSPTEFQSDLPRNIGLDDAIAVARITPFVASHGSSYRILSSSVTTYDDMRGGPAVLIGAFNNPWTMRVTDPLRFHFAFVGQGDTMSGTLADAQHPEKANWRRDAWPRNSEPRRDYAIIARLHGVTSDAPIIEVAGIGHGGTCAAAEFVTSNSQLQNLISHLPPHWQEKNVEAVIETTVIGDQAGPPELLSVHVW